MTSLHGCKQLRVQQSLETLCTSEGTRNRDYEPPGSKLLRPNFSGQRLGNAP